MCRQVGRQVSRQVCRQVSKNIFRHSMRKMRFYTFYNFLIVVKLITTTVSSQVGKEFHGPAVHWRVGRKN